jgi:hypothetical protein
MELFAIDDAFMSHAVPLEPGDAQVPPVYNFSYRRQNRETISQWSALRLPVACIINPSVIPGGDSLRGLEFQLTGSEQGWVVVDDLVFQQ